MYSFPVLRSVAAQGKKKTKTRLHMFLKEVFKATKSTTGNRLHFDTEQCRCIQYLGASSLVKAYHHCGYQFLTFLEASQMVNCT